jgi:hypothetical protein
VTVDPWVTPTAEKPQTVVAVRKYRIVSVDESDGQVATLEAADGSEFPIRFPNSITPALSAWVWCLHTNSQLWPFAVD